MVFAHCDQHKTQLAQRNQRQVMEVRFNATPLIDIAWLPDGHIRQNSRAGFPTVPDSI